MILNSISAPNLSPEVHVLIFNYLQNISHTWVFPTDALVSPETNSASSTCWPLLLPISLSTENCYPQCLTSKRSSHSLAWPQAHLVSHQIKWTLLLKGLAYWTLPLLSNFPSHPLSHVPCSTAVCLCLETPTWGLLDKFCRRIHSRIKGSLISLLPY